MDLQQVYHEFVTGMKATGWLEYIAVFAGIMSVWYSRKENILVYPTGLLNTIFYIYLSLKGGLLGEASVNFYYTVMSIYGWIMWSKKNSQHENVVKITKASTKEWSYHLLFFFSFYIVLYFAIGWMSAKGYVTGAIPG